MTPVIDSHCHLELDSFNHDENARLAAIARARAAGVSHIIAVGAGASLDNAENAIGLAHDHADISAVIGIHPHDAEHYPPATLERLEQLASHEKSVVAIGETGLDYHYHFSSKESQSELFRQLIAIARRLNKPLVLHIREAHEDARRLLVDESARDVPLIVHCFTGTLADARAYLDMGCFLSFSGVLTFKNAEEIRHAARFAPAERVLVETDAPYLAPAPYRGQPNEPAWVVETLRALATVRGVSYERAAADTCAATWAAFRLPGQPAAFCGPSA